MNVDDINKHQAVAEQLDTPAEFAGVINTTSATVLNLFHKGIIPAKIACGRLIRFDRAEALAALEKHSEGYAAQWERDKSKRQRKEAVH